MRGKATGSRGDGIKLPPIASASNVTSCHLDSPGAPSACSSQLKTNATRQLDKLGIAYELRDYEVDIEDLGAVKVAGQIGLPAAQVFKTLCAKAVDGTIVFAVVPGDHELDLKGLARLAAKRSMELVPVSQLKQLTGYIRGGVTALAAKRSYPVYLHDSALSHPVIAVSAGIRGTQILLAPQDYIRSTTATLGAIARPLAD